MVLLKHKIFFCSTSLPLASTRWVQLTLSSLCPLFLSSAVNKPQQYQEKILWECQESNLGLLGEKQVCYLCAMKRNHKIFISIFRWHLGSMGRFFELLCDLRVRGSNPQAPLRQPCQGRERHLLLRRRKPVLRDCALQPLNLWNSWLLS